MRFKDKREAKEPASLAAEVRVLSDVPMATAYVVKRVKDGWEVMTYELPEHLLGSYPGEKVVNANPLQIAIAKLSLIIENRGFTKGK